MNDGGYRAFDPGLYKGYMDGLQGIGQKARAAQIRVAWITPQPLDNADPGKTALTGYNQTLEKFSAGVQETAQMNEGVFVDQFHPYLAVLDRARSSSEQYNRITAGDAVHPGPPGQALMAASILKGLHFPEEVATVEIDAADGKVTRARRCKATDVEVKNGGVRFRQQDEALPFFPSQAASILKWAPIRDELNDYRLKVTGLKSGQYFVLLGGQKVAEYGADELGQGVNLAGAALTNGPVADRVRAVEKAVEAKNRFFHDRIFRGVVLATVNVPDFLDLKLSAKDIEAKREAALKERMMKVPELDEAIQKALVIEPHEVEIVPAQK
jgi:hypothetical protein